MVMSSLPLIVLILSGVLADQCCGQLGSDYDSINAFLNDDQRTDLRLEPMTTVWNLPEMPDHPEHRASWRRYWPGEDKLAHEHQKAVLDLLNPVPAPATLEPTPKHIHVHNTHRIYFMNSPWANETDGYARTSAPSPTFKSVVQEMIGGKSSEKKITGKRSQVAEEEPTEVEQILDKKVRRRSGKKRSSRRQHEKN